MTERIELLLKIAKIYIDLAEKTSDRALDLKNKFFEKGTRALDIAEQLMNIDLEKIGIVY